MVLTEPRGCVPVRLQDCTDGALVNRDYGIVTREPRRYFADHPVTHRVMVASRDNRSAGRRAQCGRMEVRIAQPRCGDTVERRCRDHPAKSGRRAEADIVRHDEQHVGRPLRRHDARRPPGLGLRGPLVDDPAEIRLRGRYSFPVDGRSGARRTRNARDLLSEGRGEAKCENAYRCNNTATDTHDWSSHFGLLGKEKYQR